jgi:hypothetical protein
MLEEVIAKFRDGTIRALAYLKRVHEIAQQVDQRGAADVPYGLRADDTAQAYYRVLREWAGGLGFEDRDAIAQLALDVNTAIDRERSVDWIRKTDVKNRMYQSIDDAFYLFCKEHDLPKNWSDIERASRTMVDTIAAARRA